MSFRRSSSRMTLFPKIFTPTCFVIICSTMTFGLPSLRDSIRQPSHVYEGEDALLTCVVRNLESNTLLWKREDTDRRATRILTAGENRVTSDKRYNVLHDSAPSSPGSIAPGGDVWVLVIKNVRPSDSGIYICEINSNPILRSFHTLNVIPSNLQAPAVDATAPVESRPISSGFPIEMNHTYTSCCRENGVSQGCIGFCSLKNILDGTTEEDPENCESEFPAIVKCMADGRNHVPCCADEGIPDICQDICRGEYTIPTDDIRTHVSCSAYTEQTLACIAQGIEILPSSPETVQVEALSMTSLNISWSQPMQNVKSITHYNLHISALPGFDSLNASGESVGQNQTLPFSMQIKVAANSNSTVVNNLNPFTMYEISVTAHNVHGDSLPSVKVRTLTSNSETNITPGLAAPALPDIKECCNSKGIYHSRCVEKFCDPVRTADASLPDLMICAPWASDSFSCLANGIDHTACCKARGLPPACVQLCTGNITRIDFNQFRCIQHLDDLSNCLLQGYGVLPGPPVSFRVTNINPTFAILRWDVPKTLGKTVVSYNVHYRRNSEEESDYKMINTKKVPYILENLQSKSNYEVYVSAVNEHGIGEPSVRLIFKTTGELLSAPAENGYNVTACCETAGLDNHCMPLCDYSAKLSDLKSLTTTCGKEFPKLLRCGAGGRNHISCCERRGIPDPCLGFCTGSVTEELLTTAAACLPYIGNVIQCFEEGTGLLPGPIIQLHAASITNDTITLMWSPPTDGEVNEYIVHYMKIEQSFSKPTTLELDQQMTVKEPMATIEGLTPHAAYSFFVLAANNHGTSLPSSVLTINVTDSALNNGTISGVPSAPMEISVASRSADYITVTWQHPLLTHPTDQLRYRFYYRMKNESTFHVDETSLLSYRLSNLTASTQHIIYITAVNQFGESRPSETLIAWTDPAFAPLVEVPTIHPINIVLEGGSMTIVCVAMGTPMPTVSLYVSGSLIRQEKTRHMVAVLSNVTRDMNIITCYADNGYGQPSQASKRIIIGRRPNITAPLITMANLGDDVFLNCEVDAHPPPKMLFSRDPDGLEEIANSSKYEITTEKMSEDVDPSYIMKLKVTKLESSDSGMYFCSAKNSFGTFSQTIKLQVRQKVNTPVIDVESCCIDQNVTSLCMDACTSFLDIDTVIDRPECINDFHKLMRCAADGSDHRVCCSQWGVPRQCLDWCRGETVPNSAFCALSYMKPIVSCFHEGQERIPGPPKNLRVELAKDNSVKVFWDPPSKNSDKVELYRVFWRPKGSKQADKKDTKTNNLFILGLREGVAYELVVKAGNHYGTSTFTEPLMFTLTDRYIISASTRGNSNIGVIVGIVAAIIFIACAALAAIFWMRKNNITGIKLPAGVSFENPIFPRRSNLQASDTLQIIPNEALSDSGINFESNTMPNPIKDSDVASGPSEEGPSMREELRLGSDGVGFKRFK